MFGRISICPSRTAGPRISVTLLGYQVVGSKEEKCIALRWSRWHRMHPLLSSPSPNHLRCAAQWWRNMLLGPILGVADSTKSSHWWSTYSPWAWKHVGSLWKFLTNGYKKLRSMSQPSLEWGRVPLYMLWSLLRLGTRTSSSCWSATGLSMTPKHNASLPSKLTFLG